jgi:hypothetical protein
MSNFVVFHKIQPDYDKRMKMMQRAALFWAQESSSLPMSLVPTKEQWIEERQEELIARWIAASQK